MTLSIYHQKYTEKSDFEIQKRADEKKQELAKIFEQTRLDTDSETIKIAVLGCGDRRFIKHHQIIFKDLTGKPVEITTFDIITDHLGGEPRVIRHDCTKSLPNTLFDITYAHVLLRFIETEKQWDVIKNSFDALKLGGLAIHVLDKEDYETKETRLSDGLFSVPLNRWKVKLSECNIEYKEIPIKYGCALVLIKGM